MLTRWNPFVDMLRWDHPLETRGRFQPATDIVELDDAYELQLELPGMKPENVEVSVEGNQLTISGERKYEHEDESDGYRRIERSYGSFTRSFNLPAHAQLDDIDAEMQNGVLNVRVPKAQKANKRRIAIGGKKGKSRKLEAKQTAADKQQQLHN